MLRKVRVKNEPFFLQDRMPVYTSSHDTLLDIGNKELAMLILTRRVGETLMIGDDVSVTVLGVKGNQVRIGVNAPKDVAVHREEIYRRIEDEKKQPQGPS